MTKRNTFKIDNQWLQRSPSLFAPKVTSLIQLSLPGMDRRLFAFDEWASYALYALLDPEDPNAPVRMTMTEFLETLGFVREISSFLGGYETFASDDYQTGVASLHRLYSAELERLDYWDVKKPGQKGRRDRRPVVFKGRFLISYSLIYPKGVTEADLLPPEEREDINVTKNYIPDAPPIWKAKNRPRPESIEYRIHPDLVRGLTAEDPNIGFTYMPFKIFELRREFGRNPTATRVLIWVMRQAKNAMTRDLDGLVKELRLDPEHKKYMKNQVIKSFEKLQKSGVIFTFQVNTDNTSGKTELSFVKSKDWYLANPEDNQTTERVEDDG